MEEDKLKLVYDVVSKTIGYDIKPFDENFEISDKAIKMMWNLANYLNKKYK